MSLVLKTTTNPVDAANFIASSVLHQLELGKHVLFFATGGSSIAVGIKVSDILRKHPHQNLTIMLTDERYGPTGHPDSNFFQLKGQGFDLQQAKFIPVLEGADMAATTLKFNATLERELNLAEYKAGLFGVGPDGHTAGILPDSTAITSKDFAYGYHTPQFSRITITSNVIEKLDEAFVWAQGEARWNAIKNLIASAGGRDESIDISKQPAQILKKVPLLTIFSDYRKEQ